MEKCTRDAKARLGGVEESGYRGWRNNMSIARLNRMVVCKQAAARDWTKWKK
jgi:hypothetical protein